MNIHNFYPKFFLFWYLSKRKYEWENAYKWKRQIETSEWKLIRRSSLARNYNTTQANLGRAPLTSKQTLKWSSSHLPCSYMSTWLLIDSSWWIQDTRFPIKTSAEIRLQQVLGSRALDAFLNKAAITTVCPKQRQPVSLSRSGVLGGGQEKSSRNNSFSYRTVWKSTNQRASRANGAAQEGGGAAGVSLRSFKPEEMMVWIPIQGTIFPTPAFYSVQEIHGLDDARSHRQDRSISESNTLNANLLWKHHHIPIRAYPGV